MKYIKKFENIKTPQIGDYILTKKPTDNREEIINKVNIFLNENVGRIIDIIPHKINDSYVVQYYNIPEDIFKNFNHKKWNDDDIQYENYRYVHLKDILYFSDDMFDVDTIKNVKKYNL